MVRRVGDKSSGPRTVGYDANPRGLAGTTSTASDYMRKKKKKENDKVRLGYSPPYGGDDSPGGDALEVKSKPPYFDLTDDEPAKISDNVAEVGKGSGWILAYRHGGMAHPFVTVVTGDASAYLYITDVSDKLQIKLPTAPLENGMVKHDHKVRMPKTLRVAGLVNRENKEVINNLLEYASESKSLDSYFRLTSPWKDYPKMYLSGYSSKASSKKYDVYDYTLELTELLIAQDLKDYITDKPDLASNQDKGTIPSGHTRTTVGR